MNTNVTTQSKIARKFSQNPEIKNLTPSIDGDIPKGCCGTFYCYLTPTDGTLGFFQETSPLNNNKISSFVIMISRRR